MIMMNVVIIFIAYLVLIAVIEFFVYYYAVYKPKQIKKTEAETGVKHQQRTVKEWFCAHMPTKRRLIQVYAALLYNANIKGFITGKIYTSESTKYLCVPGLNCYSCPGAVGACPLGSLQNALAESSVRAPFYVIGILGLFGLIFARTICGFLCPVGLGQELLYKVRTPKLKKNRVTYILSFFKYVLLVLLVVVIPLLYALRDVPLPAFCKYICPAGTLGGAIGLLIHPDNAAMFGMLGGQFLWKFSLLVAFIVASIFIFRFFCRFFCPLGAIYGFFNKIALIGVKIEKDKCTDCGKCVSVCKMDIRSVGDHECINCGECMSSCPTKAIAWKGSKFFLHPSAVDELQPVSLDEPAPDLQLPDATQTEGDCRQPRKSKRNKRFFIQLAGGITAIAVLVGAYVYYNVIDLPSSLPPQGEQGTQNVGHEIGQTAPDFTVSLYGSEGNFTLSENTGKWRVINFWATWCTPCVAEIPYFDQLAKEHPDIVVIAIHGSSTRDVNKFIADNWQEHVLTFAQDNLSGQTCETFELLGGSSMWPMTVIVNPEGTIVYNSTQSFHSYGDLEQLILGFTSEN